MSTDEVFGSLPERLRAKTEDAFSRCVPAGNEIITQLLSSHPGAPDEYVRFLKAVGFGGVKLGEYVDFRFLEQLLPAEVHFGEKVYYSVSDFPAPVGSVLGFGLDEEGSLYGFDTGDSWRLVCVDGRRDVLRLELGFLEFAAGVVACYPFIPVRRVNGGWEDESGQFFPEVESH